MNFPSSTLKDRQPAAENPKHSHVRVDFRGNSPRDHDSWLHAVEALYGVRADVDSACPADAKTTGWFVGALGMVEVDVAHQLVSPVPETSDHWPGENLYVKLITHGTVGLAQHGEHRNLWPSSLCVVDPAWHFEEHYAARARLIAIRVPKQALRDRGFRNALSRPIFPDLSNPDNAVVRDFISILGAQRAGPSPAVREKLAQQFLDLMGILMSQQEPPNVGRSTEATIIRAKRVIARRLGDPELSVSQIATELRISENHLGRLFRTDGTSVMKYVIRQRLEMAAKLVTNSSRRGLQMQEIAYRCGFVSAAHFSRVFKERFGFSPNQAATVEKV